MENRKSESVSRVWELNADCFYKLLFDFRNIEVFSVDFSVLHELLGTTAVLLEFTDGFGQCFRAGVVGDLCVVVLSGMLAEVCPTGSVDEDGTGDSEVFD